jgi:HEAT repeat protein
LYRVHPDWEQKLIEYVENPDENLSDGAVLALALTKPPGCVPILIRAVRQRIPVSTEFVGEGGRICFYRGDRRNTPLIALGAIGNDEALPIIKETSEGKLPKSGWHIRKTAVLALGGIRTPSSRSLLDRMALSDPHEDVRSLATRERKLWDNGDPGDLLAPWNLGSRSR